MNNRRLDLATLALLFGCLVVSFASILFTDKVIRAPDILNEYYWSALKLSKQSLSDIFQIKLHALWDIYGNGGNTLDGGGQAGQLLVWQGLLYRMVPLPVSIAWFIVLHLFVAATGVFFWCRALGTSRTAALIAGVIFALAPEMVTLINAGHVLKIATISFAPWAFFCLARGYQEKRLVWFLATGCVLALQFFHTHWQIAYYTCLAIGLYGLFHLVAEWRQEQQTSGWNRTRVVLMTLLVPLFFLSSVAMDLLPLKAWSQDTNRGVQSGSNQGKGGLDREEAMQWSMPPEELATYLIPGMFGLSRQEAGDRPRQGTVYYWGRMVFTQTSSYIGLLPWLLLPLPLLLMRDRQTWFCVAIIALGLLIAMGKYTPVYHWLFDHFPGMSRFRVPKMFLFIPLAAVSLLAARGIDLLRRQELLETPVVQRYLAAVVSLPLLLGGLLATELIWSSGWIGLLSDLLLQPTRYQQGVDLATQRWVNLIDETKIAVMFSAGYALLIYQVVKRNCLRLMAPYLLLVLFLLDVGRINSAMLVTTTLPQTNRRDHLSLSVDYLASQSKEYRLLPLASGSEQFALHKIPVLYTSMPVQKVRWQQYLDTLSLQNSLPDIMNVRWLVADEQLYEQNKEKFGDRYPVVSRGGGEVVLENRQVLPKAWLVSKAFVVPDQTQRLAKLQSQEFQPATEAVVESAPLLPLSQVRSSGVVTVKKYEGERIDIGVDVAVNSLLVLGEKYHNGWKAAVDGKPATIVPVNHILRGVYLTPGKHTVEFRFDPLPFKIGKWLTLGSFVLFGVIAVREWWLRRREHAGTA
ncbi:MAG: YfhO family protein [Trichlorobacter sp.]|uniref:YfhO family protein n=1 Tax=Trichlorobacter sp. TaxID=2911007 RepID=UPI0025647E6A|nr:YfhO family protein [Trichlorobacter sp.]MDK9717682.1 YfhO family protein [Trichlorobacter sp.]